VVWIEAGEMIASHFILGDSGNRPEYYIQARMIIQSPSRAMSTNQIVVYRQ